MTTRLDPPYYPLVYVRGYAMTQGEVEDTVATPYMGFNLGSTKIRQRWTGAINKHVFESPLVRLIKDHGYRDVYARGDILPASEEVPSRSIWIYRYYEEVSEDLGQGDRPEMEHYAEGLYTFIERIRDHMCGPAARREEETRTAEELNASKQLREEFRVHLVAHSMGGLVARCYLQNVCRKRGIDPPVDKVFTYATPHGGIDVRGFGNVPSVLQINNVENFNRRHMRKYLRSEGDDVRSLDGAFDQRRFFCLVGTNHRDYEAAMTASRRLVGPMSDGLVRIENASVTGAPRAFVHRAHSGHYGIVNSEEGYQNLRRFLFGDVRVDGLLALDEITLPAKVQRLKDEGKEVRASYHVEVVTTVRGSRTDLHSRTTAEGAALFVDYDAYVREERPKHLFSTFLLRQERVNKRRRSLGFSIDLRVLVPEYVVDGFWFNDDHYEGGYIFRDKVNLDVTMGDDAPRLRYGFDSKTANRSTREAELVREDGVYEFRIPIEKTSRPGLRGALLLRARRWG